MLTENQEKFVCNIIAGMNQADAYRNSYKCERMSDKTIYEAASRLMKNSKIIARLEELRADLAKPSILTAQQRLKWLSGIIQSKEESTADRLKASDQMNKMQGEYTQKIKASFSYEDSLREVVDSDEY